MAISIDTQTEQVITNNNTNQMNSLSLNFRLFLNRQQPVNLMSKYDDLARKHPNLFHYTYGGLFISHSSIKWSAFILSGFSSESIQEAKRYFGAPEFEVFCRLVSYNPPTYSTIQPMVNVFENKGFLKPRNLHKLEMDLFNIFSRSNKTIVFVNTFDEFINNLNNLFSFHSWYHLIDYSKFHIAGGCLVTALIANSVVLPGQDIDLFYKGSSFVDYLNSVDSVEVRLKQYFFIKRTNNLVKQVVNLRLFISSTIEGLIRQMEFIDLQFIFIKVDYSPSELLSHFDFDIVQLSFNGRSLQATFSALEVFRTGTMINYALNNDDKTYALSAIRIGKYIRRGFKLLVPLHFNQKRFEGSPTHICNSSNVLPVAQQNDHEQHYDEQFIDFSMDNNNEHDNDDFVWSKNYDCFDVQNKFRSKIIVRFQ